MNTNISQNKVQLVQQWISSFWETNSLSYSWNLVLGLMKQTTH